LTTARCPPNSNEYAPCDIPGLIPTPLHYVSGGAYDGDVLDKLLKLGYTVNSAPLFEPSPLNFS
jgi:hypothetical protein